MTSGSRILAAVAVACAASTVQVPLAQAQAPMRAYEVTITTLSAGQPLSPPLVALHQGSVDVFDVGRPASAGIQQIAENGAATMLLDALAGEPGVADVAVAGAPLVPRDVPGDASFGQSVTLTVAGPARARFLSVVSMLVCTNDGFTGTDRLRLPAQPGRSVTAYGGGYDAGTERNTEDFADIVAPCQALIGVSSGEAGTGTTNPALAEGAVVAHHEGVAGHADLVPSVHGWEVQAPLVEIKVERVS